MTTTPIFYTSDLVGVLLEQLPLLVTDMETGEVVYATHPLEAMFGYHLRGELVGQPVEVLLPDELRARHQALRQAYSTNPRPCVTGLEVDGDGRGLVMEGQRRDGTRFPVVNSLTAAVLGGRRCTITVVLDVSAYNRASAYFRLAGGDNSGGDQAAV